MYLELGFCSVLVDMEAGWMRGGAPVGRCFWLRPILELGSSGGADIELGFRGLAY